MEAIDIVLKQYLLTSMEPKEDGGVGRRTVRKVSLAPDFEIRESLPTIFKNLVAESERDAAKYRIYGSVGQINYSLARVPWVAVINRQISTSPERGYYIVLLFREDMAGCVLSLNQGYTQYKNKFGPSVAQQKIQQGAAAALSYLTIPEGFIGGPVELAASGDLGKGYERGAILSKAYPALPEIDQNKFSVDFNILLNAYDILRGKIGNDILDALPPTTEEEFQEAAASLDKEGSEHEPPLGPVPRPARSPSAPRTGYKRDPRISNKALLGADYCCAIDKEHKSFTSKSTKRNFVEAHHLIPMQFQDHFEFSLDVPENVVILCPTCHRKLHHGLPR